MAYLHLLESVGSFFSSSEPNGFVVLLIDPGRWPDAGKLLGEFRELLPRRLEVPVFLHCGPRCLPPCNYLRGTGLPPAVYVLSTTDYPEEIPIPGADYTFHSCPWHSPWGSSSPWSNQIEPGYDSISRENFENPSQSETCPWQSLASPVMNIFILLNPSYI